MWPDVLIKKWTCYNVANLFLQYCAKSFKHNWFLLQSDLFYFTLSKWYFEKGSISYPVCGVHGCSAAEEPRAQGPGMQHTLSPREKRFPRWGVYSAPWFQGMRKPTREGIKGTDFMGLPLHITNCTWLKIISCYPNSNLMRWEQFSLFYRWGNCGSDKCQHCWEIKELSSTPLHVSLIFYSLSTFNLFNGWGSWGIEKCVWWQWESFDRTAG